MYMIAQSPTLISAVGRLQAGFFTKIGDQMLSIGKVGGVYEYG